MLQKRNIEITAAGTVPGFSPVFPFHFDIKNRKPCNGANVKQVLKYTIALYKTPAFIIFAKNNNYKMGRAFEYRKNRKMARWDKMAKAFTRIGKDIAIAVKAGGTDPDNNPRLRSAMLNAKVVNMPKDKVEAAIKRAASKDEKEYQEVVYEGYAPHGIALVIECATDNPTRTVSNLRVYFNRGGGSLGTSGSVDYLFSRKGIFRFPAEGINIEELELELIDFGAEDIQLEDGQITVTVAFTDFGNMFKGLESKGINASSETQRIPLTLKELSDEEADAVVELLDRIEDDDDVQAVYSNML